MLTSFRDDRLLFATRLILNLLLALLALLYAAAVVAIPVMLFAPDLFHPRPADRDLVPDAQWVAAMLALIAAGLALGFLFIRQLRRIVDTVTQGDPFVPVNADRLRTMAWLALAIQALAILATPLIIWFDTFPNKANVHHNDDGVSLGALVLALLLFVLARVFRVGAQMREDLEGTV